MGNCSKPQQKKKLHEPVRVLKEHFRFRQLQILNRFNPVQVYRLRSHFLRQKSGHGVQYEALSALYPGLSALPETYLKNLFSMLDLTRDGVICFTDFCVGVARVSLAGDEEQVRFLFDFLNLRATEDISQDMLLSAIKTGALVPKPGNERLNSHVPPTLGFDRFAAFAALHFDVQASLAFGTFLPSPKQQKTDVLNMMAQARGPRLGETWYLLSADWVCAWQRYVSYPINLTSSQCELKSGLLDEDDIPTAIDNAGLCDSETQMLLVAEEEKYVAVPEGVWTYWTELYGGGPALPRNAYQTTDGGVELDLHPCLFLCFHTKNTVYDSSKVEKILVSRYCSLSEIKTQLVRLLKISDPGCELYVKQRKEWGKLTQEFRLETVKVAVKCILIESESPLIVSNTLRETHSPAVSSDMKTVRILSPGSSDISLPPVSQGPDETDPASSRPVSLQMKGVPNIGNTCYLNCVLQCLCYTPLFGQFFLNRGFVLGLNTHSITSLSPAIADMFGNMTGSKVGVPDSTRVHRLLGEQFDLFQGHDENDSYECLISLLDRLHEELKRGNTRIVLSSSLNSPSAAQLIVEIGNLWNELHGDFGSPVSDLFSGVMKTDVSCPRCPHHTIALTPAFSLDLPIPSQTHLYLTLLLVPLTGPAITLGLVLPVSNTVETLLKHAKSTLAAEEMGDLILVSWSYGCVFFIYDRETPIQEVVHDGSVNLYAFELDLKGSKPVVVETGEAAPTPAEAQPQGRILLKIVHRFHVPKGTYQIRDYFPEVFYVPETITTARLFQVIMDGVKRFLNPETTKELVKFGVFFVDSVSKMCGICSKQECLGCGLVASENPMEWTKLKENCVLWVQWEAPGSFLLERLKHPSLEEVHRQQSKGVDLSDCLDHFSHPETLSAECSHCHSPRVSTQVPVKLPDVLVLTLCRFRMSENVPIKVNYLVRFPLRGLNLGKWVGCSEAEKNSCTVLTTPLQYVYDLYAVVDHIGNARSGQTYIGHYRAYCKIQEDKETWVKFDDSQSSEVQGRLEDTLVTSSAYILFYKKRIMQGKNLIQFFT